MGTKEHFLRKLGARIAEARKRSGLTQSELGHDAGISQQLVADHENGNRHIPAWQLVCTADALGIDVAELLGEVKRVSRRPGPTPKIQKQLESIAALPKEKRRFVEEVLTNILKGSKEKEKRG